jgi:hypothetical protein
MPGPRPLSDQLPLVRLDQLAMNVTVRVPSSVVSDATPTTALAVDEVRLLLLRESTSRDVRDRVWRHVGARARSERGDWNVFALGLAYPGLIRRAVRLSEGTSFFQKSQVHFRLAVEFLFALHRLDLSTPNVVSRLIGAAYDQASGRKRGVRPLLVDIHTIDETDLPTPAPPSGDPARVLTRLIQQTRTAKDGYRLTRQHATLIARTYLDGDKLYTVAADLRISPANASKQRARAELLIARHLGRPDLAQPRRATPGDDDPQPSPRRPGTWA